MIISWNCQGVDRQGNCRVIRGSVHSRSLWTTRPTARRRNTMLSFAGCGHGNDDSIRLFLILSGQVAYWVLARSLKSLWLGELWRPRPKWRQFLSIKTNMYAEIRTGNIPSKVVLDESRAFIYSIEKPFVNCYRHRQEHARCSKNVYNFCAATEGLCTAASANPISCSCRSEYPRLR